MPYVTAIINILADLKGWLLALGGVVAVVMNIGRGIKYQAATQQEKAEIVVQIRNSLFMIGGIFFLAWFGLYLYDVFSAVQ